MPPPRKKEPKNDLIQWAGLIVLVVLLLGAGTAGAWYLLQPDPTVPVIALQQELEKEGNVPWDQRREGFDKFRKAMDKLTPEQQAKVHRESPRLKKELADAAGLCALANPEERAAFLDQKIDEETKKWQERRAARGTEGGGPPPGAGGPPGGPGGNGGPPGGPPSADRMAKFDQIRRERIQTLPPDQRAQLDQYQREMRAQRERRGQTGGGRGGPPR